MCISCHLRTSQRHNKMSLSLVRLSKTNATASEIVEVISLDITWISQLRDIKCHMYIVPPEVISAAHFINHSHQQYHNYSLSNCWGRTLMLLESLYQPSATWNHLNGVLHKSLSSVIPTLQPLKLLRQITWCYLNAWTNRHEIWWAYDATWVHLNNVREIPPIRNNNTTASRII
jgi:hypothetical protein